MIKSETSLVIKCSTGTVQTYTKILNLCYDLDLAHNNQTFLQAPPEHDNVASKYAWFSIKLCLVAKCSAANIFVIKAIWHWLTVIPSLVTKGRVVQKISGQDPDWHTPGWGFNESKECGWEADGQFVTHG